MDIVIIAFAFFLVIVALNRINNVGVERRRRIREPASKDRRWQ